MAKFFVIYCSEDGDKSLSEFSAEQLTKALEDEDWGENCSFGNVETDLDYFSGIIIIKGEIVIPKPKDIIKSFSL